MEINEETLKELVQSNNTNDLWLLLMLLFTVTAFPSFPDKELAELKGRVDVLEKLILRKGD